MTICEQFAESVYKGETSIEYMEFILSPQGQAVVLKYLRLMGYDIGDNNETGEILRT